LTTDPGIGSKYDTAPTGYLLYSAEMSYQVFARKYRPMTFEDIVAQEHVTRTLQNAVKNDRIASGYLFCGPRGTGKTTTARVLAKALNCINGPTPTPCGECATCREITAGTSLDVLEIDAASNTGVDDIRTLRENVRYLPTGGKKRIYIIDEVHRLSGAAFDALLKTLEEPPPHVVFVFATTEPLKVPETILSRTQRFDFKRVSVVDLVANLKNIAASESLKIDETALKMIARKADGSVRDSLSLLDQIAAYSGTEMTEKEVITALGLVDKKLLFDFTAAVASRDSRAVLRIIRTVFEAGVDPADFVAEMMEHLRTLLVLATDPEAADTLNFTPEELDQHQAQAGYFSVGDIVRLMKMGVDLTYDLKGGLDERLALEMTGVKMAEMEATIHFEDILKQLSQSAPGQSGNLFGDTEKKKTEPPSLSDPRPPAMGREPVDRRPSGPGHVSWPGLPNELSSRSVNLPIIRAGWEKFLGCMRPQNPMLASLLSMAEVREVQGDTVRLVFPVEGESHRQIVQRGDNLSLIVAALREHYKANLSIAFDIDREKGTNSGNQKENILSKTEVDALVENSPRLKRLLTRVDGEIIGVRKTKDNTA
jgi:DNA polymerase-3 subunit gamma/tau